MIWQVRYRIILNFLGGNGAEDVFEARRERRVLNQGRKDTSYRPNNPETRIEKLPNDELKA
jgi:hypothetical protein